MKRLVISLLFAAATTLTAFAQKYALVDMEYILKNIPNYEMMNEQLESVSKKWQQEVQKVQTEAETLYKKYQKDLVFLSAAQKKTREDEIVKKEQAAAELQTKYFGPEGELYKKRNEMISQKPIASNSYLIEAPPVLSMPIPGSTSAIRYSKKWGTANNIRQQPFQQHKINY